MDAPVFYRDGGFEVNAALLRTPRRTYDLSRIEYVSVQRPLLLFAGLPAIGLVGFVLMFWRYLEPGEGVTLIGLSSIAIAVSLRFGTLRVHSLALRDDEVAASIGPIGRLRLVRAAVEHAMTARKKPEQRP